MQSCPVWGTLAVARPIRLSISRTGPPQVMAAEQFLPPGKLETMSVVDTTFGSHPGQGEPRHCRRRPRGPHAAHGSLPLVLGLALTLALAGGVEGSPQAAPNEHAYTKSLSHQGQFQRPVSEARSRGSLGAH